MDYSRHLRNFGYKSTTGYFREQYNCTQGDPTYDSDFGRCNRPRGDIPTEVWVYLGIMVALIAAIVTTVCCYYRYKEKRRKRLEKQAIFPAGHAQNTDGVNPGSYPTHA